MGVFAEADTVARVEGRIGITVEREVIKEPPESF
jgi:hypothetical protein